MGELDGLSCVTVTPQADPPKAEFPDEIPSVNSSAFCVLCVPLET
jgi:hypothetical protein